MRSAFIIHRVVHLKRCKRGVNPFEKSSEFPIFRAFLSTEIACPSRRTVFFSYLCFSLSEVCSFPNQVSNYSLLIDCSDLFKLNHRQNMVIADPADVYVRRLTGTLFDPGCDRCDDQGGTMPVAEKLSDSVPAGFCIKAHCLSSEICDLVAGQISVPEVSEPSDFLSTKKEAAPSAGFCKNNRLRLVTLFQILSPVHFVYNAVCCFCIADSNGRL